jgi:transcriptional regulator with XRE-family HTH domain
MTAFTEWLEQELKNREWRPADLAREARLGDATLSRIINGVRNPGASVCRAIAAAFVIPPEEVFRHAELLPPGDGTQETTKLPDWLFRQLKKYGWSHGELARRSEISRPLVSQVISGNIPPSADFCLKIASALGKDPKKVLKKAGLLPPPTKGSLEELIDLTQDMTRKDLKKMILFAEYLRWGRQRFEI